MAKSATAPRRPASITEAQERRRELAALQKAKAGQTLTAAERKRVQAVEERVAAQRLIDTLTAVPQKTLCELLGSQRKIILDWERAGLPAERVGRSKVYDLFRVLPWLKERWRGDGAGGEGTRKRDAEIKLLIRREAAIELKMQIASGKLLDRYEVEAENAGKVIAVRSGLEALQRSLAPAVAELGEEPTVEEIEIIIWEHVEPLLRTFAGRTGKMRRREPRVAREPRGPASPGKNKTSKRRASPAKKAKK